MLILLYVHVNKKKKTTMYIATDSYYFWCINMRNAVVILVEMEIVIVIMQHAIFQHELF